MTPDPKWLEILKASGWQTLAVALACGFFLLLARWSMIPALQPWMIQLAVFAGLLCGFLTVASFIVAMNRLFPVGTWLVHWIKLFREQHALRNYIPHMTEDERNVIGYLLAHNQKMFTAAGDGGYGATLLSQGIIVVALHAGQAFTYDDTPMAIPDHLWKVLIKHRTEFPISEEVENGPYPWRVPWNAR